MKTDVREVLRTRSVVIAIAVLVVTAGTVTAVSVLTRNPNTVTAAEGSLSSSVVTVDAQSLSYSGTDATDLDVVLNNTDGTNGHTVDLHFALRESDGTLVESSTNSSVSVSAGATKTVTWTFSSSHPVDTFSQVEVTVEQTG